MQELKLTRLTVRGFSGFQDEQSFDFGPENEITGDNYKNKTTIGEAVIYALAGTDREGKANQDGALINNKSTELHVELAFEKDGLPYTVTRQATKDSKGKTTGTLFLDGIKFTQDKLDATIADKRYLLAAFLPQFFLQLEPAKAREILMTLLPIPAEEEIRARLADQEIAAIGEHAILDTDFYLKNKAAELKAFEKEALELKGAADEVARTLASEKIAEPVDEETPNATVQAIREAIATIQSAKPEQQSIEQLQHKRVNLRTEYDMVQKGLKYDEKFITCPKCGEQINLTADLEAENERITKRMNELVEEGIQVKAQVEAITLANQEAAATFERENGETVQELQRQLSEATVEHGKAQMHNADVRAQQKQREKAQERQKTIGRDKELAQNSIDETKMQIQAGKAYSINKAEIAVEKIQQHLERVSIRLFDIVKSTGEIKPIFKCDYDGKPYARLSTSEGIRAGLEIAKLFRALTKTNYPVFIDYAESITHFEKPETQIIAARVVKGQELKFNGGATIAND